MQRKYKKIIAVVLFIVTAMIPLGKYSGQTTDQWVKMSTGLPANAVAYSIVINPQDPDTLFVTVNSEVYKTTDGAATWVKANTGLEGLFVRNLAIDPINPSTLFVGTIDGGVYKTIDGGQNWVEINNGLTTLNTPVVAVNTINSSTVYAGTSKGVFKSINSGASWSLVMTSTYSINGIVIDPISPSSLYAFSSTPCLGCVYKSMNGGSTWTIISNGIEGMDVNNLVINPLVPSTLFVGIFDGGVYQTTNGGQSWTHRSLEYSLINAMAIDPVKPNILYLSIMSSGIYRSTDSGLSWADVSYGLDTKTGYNFAFDPTNSAIVYLAAANGVYKYVGTQAATLELYVPLVVKP